MLFVTAYGSTVERCCDGGGDDDHGHDYGDGDDRDHHAAKPHDASDHRSLSSFSQSGSICRLDNRHNLRLGYAWFSVLLLAHDFETLDSKAVSTICRLLPPLHERNHVENP